MTELLQRVIAELEKLSEQEQDAIAARILAELEDGKAWQGRFESTTDAQWDCLAEMVRQEIAAGKSGETFVKQTPGSVVG
jgi:rRNA-processing protein FCF1